MKRYIVKLLACGLILGTHLQAQSTSSGGGYTYNAVTDGGAVGDGVTDNTLLLANAFSAANAAGQALFIPAGTYKVSGTVYFQGTNGNANGTPISVFGVVGKTLIASTSTTADILHVGNGQLTGQLVSGGITGINVSGPTNTPNQNGQTALKIDGLTQFHINSVNVGGTDIGFDLINNCYGAIFQNDRAGFYGNNNVGLNLRTGTVSGNQIFVHDSWISGALGAVYMSPGFDGLYWTGGQASNSANATSDNGVFNFGIDYLTGSKGNMGTIKIDTVDSEGAAGWFLRGYGQANVTVQSSDILSNGNVHTVGVMKVDYAAVSNFDFENNEWGGPFSNSVPIVIGGDYGASFTKSSGWNGSNLSFAGTAYNADYGVDPCVISAIHCSATFRPFRNNNGVVDGATVEYLDGLYRKFVSGAYQISPDGHTWHTVSTN